MELNKKQLEALENFYYQVNNGGLLQWVYNEYTDEAQDVLDALWIIGANETRRKLECKWNAQDTDDCRCDYCLGHDENEDAECSLEFEEETIDFIELSEYKHREITPPYQWNDYHFYKSSDSELIKSAIEQNQGWISETGSVILDAIKAAQNA